MKYFATDAPMTTYVLQLDQGDLLLESIQALIDREHITTGAVIACAGTLDQTTLHMITSTEYPPALYFETRDDEPLELASVQGVIAGGVPHLHAVVANTKQAFAGHLEEGCRVLYLTEIVVVSFPGLSLGRVLNEKGILKIVEV